MKCFFAGALHGAGVVTVRVGDDAEAPRWVDVEGAAVDENAGVGTLVKVLLAADDDAGDRDALEFRLLGDSETSAFALGAASGRLTVVRPADLDHEAAATVSVEAAVRDLRGEVPRREPDAPIRGDPRSAGRECSRRFGTP